MDGEMIGNDLPGRGQRADLADENAPIAPTLDKASGNRRPYQAPKLTHLGSVRELTWGAGGSGGDFTNMQP
jgi:hypothetical protein